jgi:hypothetical protein
MQIASFGIEYVAEDWEDGLVCVDCGHVFREGERYAERLYAFAGEGPVVEVVCVGCATAAIQTP